MIDLLLIYGAFTIVATVAGVGTWYQAKGDMLKQGERRWGARVALLSWAWPFALPIAIIVGLIWLICELLLDAFGD